MRYCEASLVVFVIFLWAAASARAQDPHEGWFPFVIPDLADEETAGSPIDLSYLNPEPAGAHGFLRPDGEQVVDADGRPVRLFGSNITDYHAMPPKEVAPLVAERLRQLGINFIRLHYFDWDVAPRGILNEDRQTLDPEKLDQLDFLIANLKRCGVYVDINLHVARGYRDMPEGWDRMGKSIDIIHGPYIESQKQYARDLLTHVNPYTGNAYVDEPAVAIIELNNENTALRDWQRYADLPERFSGPLAAKWNAWLRDEYRSTEALRAAWNANPPHGPELLRNGDLGRGTDDWVLQNSGGAESTVSVLKDAEGQPYLRWEATKAGTQEWHLQFFQPAVPVQHQKEYVLAFRARSDEPRELVISLMQQQEPWGTVGPPVRLKLIPEWREYGASWMVENETGAPVRLNIACANRVGVYGMGTLSLKEGGLAGLREGESIEAGNVPLVSDTASAARAADYIAFLMDLELRYVQAMKRLIKEELGSKSMVFETQVSYGGLAGLVREAKTGDVIDCHAYPAHPRREQDAQGMYWSIRNVSMVDGAFGGLEGLALRRVAGKPYFVTEFDLNPPNDHASETFPMLALMAAYQGWSGIADYAWYNFQRDYGHSRISSVFATTGHAGQMAFVPTAALVFRLGLVAPAETRATLTVHDDRVSESMVNNVWYGLTQVWNEMGIDASEPWRVGTAVRLAEGAGEPQVNGAPGPPDGPMVSDTGEITFDRGQEGEEYLAVSAPAVRLLIGRLASRRFELDDVIFSVSKGTFRDYANIALVALDAKPIAESRKLLLTAVARVENKGQVWNEDRTSVGRDWGEGPTMAEPMGLQLTLPGTGWRAQALDGKGQPKGEVPMEASALAAGGEYATLWYLIER